jgi:hypothetical protein
MLGSVCNPDARVRQKALDHLLACIDVMDATGSRDLKLWFSDGTNYPGQDDIRARQDRLAEALAAVHARLGPDQRMLLEYKFFEPSFYTMDVPDWGTAYIQCVTAGPKAKVVVDTGHHAPGTNIEFIVASLLLRVWRTVTVAILRRLALGGRREHHDAPRVAGHGRQRHAPGQCQVVGLFAIRQTAEHLANGGAVSSHQFNWIRCSVGQLDERRNRAKTRAIEGDKY